MYLSKDGLGDADYKEVAIVAEKIDSMDVGDEVEISAEIMETNQLFETVLDAFVVAGFKNVLNCVRYRWFFNEDDHRAFVGVFYKEKEKVVLRRSENYA